MGFFSICKNSLKYAFELLFFATYREDCRQLTLSQSWTEIVLHVQKKLFLETLFKKCKCKGHPEGHFMLFVAKEAHCYMAASSFSLFFEIYDIQLLGVPNIAGTYIFLSCCTSNQEESEVDSAYEEKTSSRLTSKVVSPLSMPFKNSF